MEDEFEFDYANAEAVKEFIGGNAAHQKLISEYAKEYKGTEGGRKLRPLQVGHREDYTQGKKPRKAEKQVTRFPKYIVNNSVGFLLGDAPSILANDPDNEKGKQILKVFKDNRIGNKLQDFAESVMSTTIGVFIFSKDVEGKIKARLYNHKNGKYTPQFDMYGDLVAFYWEFDLNEVEHIWIFTATEIHKYEDETYLGADAHDFGVIPVAFLEQDEPEWFITKEDIDRYEMLKSKLAGSNNYFAFPMLKLLGAMKKNEETGEEESAFDIDDDGTTILLGQMIQDDHVLKADAEFIQRDTGIESIELEKDWLKEDIHKMTQTPDFSLDNLKGVGPVSGRALMFMLTDPLNKAKRKRGAYDTLISRVLSIIKHGLGITDDELEFDIEFNYSIPDDLKETIEMLYAATGSKATMSQETAVQNNPLVKNPSEELEKIKAEGTQNLGENYNF